ncbi:chromosomal replication initiator protein DnaA, partial [Patescibacteria group bacterium]|nr:chromosomal replication initiator protein DnaA [Patescibacteria group bacterium]
WFYLLFSLDKKLSTLFNIPPGKAYLAPSKSFWENFMEKNAQEKWQAVLAEIETDVSRANFLTLFKPTVLISFQENVATIAAPSNMIIDLLQRRFFEIIKKSTSKHLGENVRLVFVPRVFVSEKSTKKPAPLFEEDLKPIKIIGHLPRVRAEYTFENMAVSSSNQLAYVSARAVSEKIGKTYNPLFIYGPVGVGKTHLMQAIANSVYVKSPTKKILYITSEEFTNEVVESIRSNATAVMKRRFRNLDLLIIDDIQFMAGKEKVQEELFHTFNILVDKGAQICLSSDRPPVEIKKVEKRLISRFSGGLTVDIESPDFELRAAILLIKASKLGYDLSMEIAKKIAEQEIDARSLEGLLLRIVSEAASKGESVSEELVDEIVGGKKNETSPFHPDEIIKNTCSFYRIKPTQIKGKKRDSLIVRARHVAMFLLKKELGLTYVEIGNLLGGRDHTTIIHGVGKIESLMKNEIFSGEIMRITNLKSERIVE